MNMATAERNKKVCLFVCLILASRLLRSCARSFEESRKSQIEDDHLSETDFFPKQNSLFEYLLLNEDNKIRNATSSNILKKECFNKNYVFSVYHQVVYSYVCNRDWIKSSNHVCDQSPPAKGISNDYCVSNRHYNSISQQSLRDRACLAITTYMQCRNMTITNTTNSIRNFIYKEFIFEDMPFCFPFSCPLFISKDSINYSQVEPPTLFQCMPFLCKVVQFFIIILDASMSIITTIANGLILLVAVRTSHFYSPHGFFLISLSVADLLVGVVTEPCMVYNGVARLQQGLTLQPQDNLWYRNLSGFITNTSLGASLLTLMCSTAFRYFAVTHSNHYWRHEQKYKTYALRITSVVWFSSMVVGILPVHEDIIQDEYKIHAVGMTLSKKMDEMYIYLALLLLGLIVLWILTIKLWFRVRGMNNDVCRDEAPSKIPRQCKKENAICATLRMIIIAFTICYLPLVIAQALMSLPVIDLENHPKLFNANINFVWNICMFITSRMVLANSFLNFIIYSLKEKQFKEALSNVFSLRHSRRL